MKGRNLFRLGACTLGLMLAGAALAQNEGVRAEIFADADAVKASAEEANTELFAPGSHAEAMEYYQEAERSFERGRAVDRIQEDLAMAVQHFNTALKTTELSKLTLETAIAARASAEEAEAYREAERTWADAEETFEQAVAELEDGNLDRARRLGGEAAELYTQAAAESAN